MSRMSTISPVDERSEIAWAEFHLAARLEAPSGVLGQGLLLDHRPAAVEGADRLVAVGIARGAEMRGQRVERDQAVHRLAVVAAGEADGLLGGVLVAFGIGELERHDSLLSALG